MPLYCEGDPATWVRTFEEDVTNLVEFCSVAFRDARRLTIAMRSAQRKAIEIGVLLAAKVVRIELGLDPDDGSRRYTSEATAVALYGEPFGTDLWFQAATPPNQ